MMQQVPLPPGAPDLGRIIVDTGNAPPFWVTLPPQVVLLIVLSVCAAAAMVLYPIVRAIGRRIEGAGAANPAVLGELEDLRGRIHELEAGQTRMAEIEDRLDFAERMLAQQRNAAIDPVPLR